MPTARGPDPALEEHFLGSLYRGGELLASGKIIEAREHLEKAHELEPKNEKAKNLLGLTYFKLGLFDLAARVYEQLVLENPADPTLRVNLGLVHLKTGDLERSTREFETAIDLDPGHKKAHNYLGLALAQKGDYARAREHFLLAGSEPMAEKMERALEAKGTISATELPLSPLPAEPPARPMPPLSTPEGAEPPPPPPDHLELKDAQGELSGEPSGPHPTPPQLDAATEPMEPAELAPPSLASDWGTHVPDQLPSVPEFLIEERPLAEPPVEPQFAHDDATPAFSMNDAPLVHLDTPLDPVEMHVESLPPAFEPLPAMDPTQTGASSHAQAEGSMWLTEHVADVPLSSDSPAVPGTWSSPPWIGSEALAAESPQWTQAQAEDTGWMTDAQPAQKAASSWPTAVEEEPAWQSEGPPAEPQGEPEAPAGDLDRAPGLGDPSWTTEAASEAPTPPEPGADESNWVMQPVSEAFHHGQRTEAWAAAPPPPAPSGFASMPSRRLSELGDASSWAHEATADPFQVGPTGLAVTVAGEMLMRTEGLVAVVGGLTVTPELRRRRGRPTFEPFGEGPSQLHRVTGHGVVYLEGNQGFHSLDLSDQPSTAIDDEGAYVQEALVFAFEEAVAFDNGRLTDEAGRWVDLVHLKGHGRVLLKLDGALKAMPIPAGTPTMVPVNRLVGWFGRVTPRLVGFGGQGGVELTGEGFALLLT